MIFTVDRNKFERAITPVSIVSQNKAPESKHSGILLEAKEGELTFYCYDVEKGIRTTVEADVESEGRIIVDPQIVPIIHSLPSGEIRIETDENFIIKLTSGEADFQILGRNGDTYPEMPRIKGFSKFKMTKKQFGSIINRTCFAVSKDESKPILRGSKFYVTSEKISVSAIDGFRVAVRNEKSESENPDLRISFIMPGKAQMSVLKLMDDSDEELYFELSNKHMIIKVDGMFMLFRLLEGEFPEYKRYLPEYVSTAEIDRASLISSLERVALINDKLKASARLIFSKGQLKINCETDKGKINDLIPCNVEGKDLEIHFNQNYLIDALKACDDDYVFLKIAEKGKGMVIEPRAEDVKEESGYLQLVMPVRQK